VQIEADGRAGPFSLEVTARLGRGLRRGIGQFLLGEQIGLEVLALIVDMHQRAGVSRQLQVIGDDQCQGLAAVEHAVVVQRAKRRAIRRIVIGKGVVIAGDFRAVEMMDNIHHTR